MIIQQIFFFFLLVSSLAIIVLFFKKVPQLCSINSEVYQNKEANFFKKKILSFKNSRFVSEFSWINIYQRILSRIRVLILRFEKRIADHLYYIRKKNRKED